MKLKHIILSTSLRSALILGLPAALLLAGCSGNNTSTTESGTRNETPKELPPPRVEPPVFSADSAYSYVKAQADMGPRTPGSKAHDAAVAYFEKKLKAYGAEVTIQQAPLKSFDGKPWQMKNVIAAFNPAAATRILLSAHYDSRPFADRDARAENKTKAVPGVNDGASGAGVLLEVARQLALKQPSVGVDIILFDLEDYGNSGGGSETWCLGSQYWAAHPHKIGYTAKYGILLDMVGAKDAVFPKEGISVFYANDIVGKVWSAANTAGAGHYFVNEEIGEITDDHLFVNKIAQIPCVDIIHYNPAQNDFFEHHHQVTDDLGKIDKATLGAVGQTLLEVIYNEH